MHAYVRYLYFSSCVVQQGRLINVHQHRSSRCFSAKQTWPNRVLRSQGGLAFQADQGFPPKPWTQRYIIQSCPWHNHVASLSSELQSVGGGGHCCFHPFLSGGNTGKTPQCWEEDGGGLTKIYSDKQRDCSRVRPLLNINKHLCSSSYGLCLPSISFPFLYIPSLFHGFSSFSLSFFSSSFLPLLKPLPLGQILLNKRSMGVSPYGARWEGGGGGS